MDPLFLDVYNNVPEEMRCKYPSKRCDRVRVVKRDGELHRFCEFHRLKANTNQQRLEQRRRMASPRTTSPRTTARTPMKRTKRSTSAVAPLTTGSPNCVLDMDGVSLPTLRMDDLDLDLLVTLLDHPQTEGVDTNDTQAALRWLEKESAHVDSQLMPVLW